MDSMTDFNALPVYSDQNAKLVTMVVEIPAKGQEKIEWNHQKGSFCVQRNLLCALPELVNYGFIPQSLAGDGDNLDVLVLTEKQLKTGQVLAGRVIGVMLSEDEGQEDHKIITILNDSFLVENKITDLHLKITEFFNNYKKKPGQYKIIGWEDEQRAHLEIKKAQERWQEFTSRALV